MQKSGPLSRWSNRAIRLSANLFDLLKTSSHD
jgi:hypothetical protein